MTYQPITLFSLISGLIQQANDGLYQALEASSGEDPVFVSPQIEVKIRCFVTQDGTIKISPSNGLASNYYGVNGDSLLSLKLKLQPK